MSNSLIEICATDYFPLRPTIRTEATRLQYRIALRSFAEQLGRAATLTDLTDDALTRWMTWLMDRQPPLSVNTIRERVGRVQTLWTWLAKRGVVKQWPTITRPAPVDPLPTALTEEQLRRLFASAAKERGKIADVPADLWWLSFLGFVWNTSERKSAVLAVRVEWLDLARGVCTIPPDVRKGRRKWGVYHLWPELVPLLKECLAADPTRELVWPWDRCAGSYYTSYNRILRDAEIPVSRKTKTHGLRVSHATWLKGCTRPAFAGPLQPAELPPFPPRLRPRPSAIRNPTRPPVLVLSRHRDEAIVIADNIKITVVEIRGDKVRLGIDAPKDISVHRQEVYAEIQRGRAGSSEESASPGRP